MVTPTAMPDSLKMRIIARIEEIEREKLFIQLFADALSQLSEYGELKIIDNTLISQLEKLHFEIERQLDLEAEEKELKEQSPNDYWFNWLVKKMNSQLA